MATTVADVMVATLKAPGVRRAYMSIEGEFLRRVMNDLMAELPGQGAELVLSVTGQGNRQWVAYASSHDWLQAWAPGFATRWLDGRRFRIGAAKDPDWTTYGAFSRRG